MAGMVLSVNVGRARTVMRRGRPVATGIWKAPVDLHDRSRAGELLAAEALPRRWRSWAERQSA